ncbi:MAG: DNA double-strand break repair nuclease NurA [Candidatus Thermoplasmatota archaeon]|jgi:hypothetical protein|nr:DNA double-strand break repair nuclease NurA [Candidatus Thermoplasmatota archaeon]
MYNGPAKKSPSMNEALNDVISDIRAIIPDNTESRFHAEMFTPFTERPGVCRVGAVDGSSTIVIRGPSFIVGSYKSASMVFTGHELAGTTTTPTMPILISKDNLNDVYGRIFSDFVGEPPRKKVRDLELALQRIRVIEEMKMVSGLVEEMDPGSIILVDGPLRSTITKLDAFMEATFKKALEKNISVVGISKSSSLSMDNTAIVPLVQYEAKRVIGKRMWCFDVGEKFDGALRGHQSHLFGSVNIVKFNPHSDFVFRADILTDEDNETEILRKISPYCRDPSYLGYPYPLALVHNEVSITRGRAEDMHHHMKEIALTSGINSDQWRFLCQDFHDVLDRGV